MASCDVKRRRTEEDGTEVETAPGTLTLRDVQMLQLNPLMLSLWAQHPLLKVYAAGSFVRVCVGNKSGTRVYAVGLVLGLGQDTSREYRMPTNSSGAGSQQPITTHRTLHVMLLGRPDRADMGERLKPREEKKAALTSFSSSPITQEELDLALQCMASWRARLGSGAPAWATCPTPQQCVERIQRRRRLDEEARRGRAVVHLADGALWGSQGHPCSALLLLRSWHCRLGPVQGTALPMLLDPKFTSAVAPPSTVQRWGKGVLHTSGVPGGEGETVPALGACPTPPAWCRSPPGDWREDVTIGAMLRPEKFRGQFSFLMKASLGSQGRLEAGLLGGKTQAAPDHDEHKPEVTAWRALRDTPFAVKEELTLERFCSAVLAMRGLAGSTAGGAGPSPAGTAAAPASGRRDPMLMPGKTRSGTPAAQAGGAAHFSAFEGDVLGFRAVDEAAAEQWAARTSGISAVQVFLVDLDALARLGCIRYTCGDLPQPPSTDPPQWACVSETAVCSAPAADAAPTQAPVLVKQPVLSMLQSPNMFLDHPGLGGGPAGRENEIILYHGCGVTAATSIVATGFRRPVCRKMQLTCQQGMCLCQMQGMGVYFARMDKALNFSARKASVDVDVPALKAAAQAAGVPVVAAFPETGEGPLSFSVGILLQCRVRLGRCKLQGKVRDPVYSDTPQGKVFTDHTGRWNAWEGYDSLYIRDNSRPACAVAEWAVSDPGRCTVRAVVLTRTTTSVDDVEDAVAAVH